MKPGQVLTFLGVLWSTAQAALAHGEGGASLPHVFTEMEGKASRKPRAYTAASEMSVQHWHFLL